MTEPPPTGEHQHRPDWYPDPSGRYDYRFHNGRDWTGDVSRGGYRTVDPLGTEPPAPAQHRDGRATAALVLGIIALTTAWMPFVVAAGAICAVLAIVFGVVAHRRPNRDTRGFATVGVVTGICALGLAALGVWFTSRVMHAINDFADPPDYTIELSQCEVEDVTPPLIHVAGTITNVDTRDGDYRIVIDVDDTSGRLRRLVITVFNARPGRSRPFEDTLISNTVITDIDPSGTPRLDDGALACHIVDVTGPLPFGMNIEVN